MSAALRHLMTMESATNAAYRDVTARDVTTRLERRHAGFRVMSGPYAVQVRDKDQRRAEEVACARAMRDQQRVGCAAKIVMVGEVAYVLRSTEGWTNGVDPEVIRSPERGGW